MEKTLKIKEIEGPFGPVNVLVDQDGDVLPGQTKVVVEDGCNAVRIVTVTFKMFRR